MLKINKRVEMLNRRAGSQKFKPDQIIQGLDIQKGDVIADIGSGGGFYTGKFATETGLKGLVYAVDKNDKFLSYIDQKASEKGLEHIKTVHVDQDKINIPEKSCDLIFLRNVFHHLEDPEKYFCEMKRYLKPGGRIAIIDYKKRMGFNFISLFGHYTAETIIMKALAKSGYQHLKRFTFLPEQSFNIFSV